VVCGVRHNWFYSARVVLMALGLGGERLAALSNSGEEMAYRHWVLPSTELDQLIDPLGLGGFGVWFRAKD